MRNSYLRLGTSLIAETLAEILHLALELMFTAFRIDQHSKKDFSECWY
jgi:hypothetical protein